ncbi:MAG: hypothetical protein J0L51_07310 [Rhizobiales bacterium]|nr:hypothetical protein [Hyphomicrobiales bacterium]
MRLAAFFVALTIGVPALAQDTSKLGEWREWLSLIVKDIRSASRTENLDLLERRIRRPNDFLASGTHLPEENNIRIHCMLAAQSAANYALSLRQGKPESARADLKEYQRHDKDCAAAIKKPRLEAAVAMPLAPKSLSTRSPLRWLEEVKQDAENARSAARVDKMNIDVLQAVAKSALRYRERIQDWDPGPARSEAFGLCGNVVIALARVDQRPRDAFGEYDRVIGPCERAIGSR